MARYLRISLNPSSWFTNQFVEFYKDNYEKDYHFEIYTAGVRTVMERVRDYLSDIGFVYVMEQQIKEFQYELSKNRLSFYTMQESTATFYPGRRNKLYQTGQVNQQGQAEQQGQADQPGQEIPMEKKTDLQKPDQKWKVSMDEMKQLRFIQNYRDEFLELGDREKRGVFSWEELDVAVITNSDYIMEKMLRETDLSNISGSYLSDDKKAANKGIPLEFKKNKIYFGYIRRKNDEQNEMIDELLEFLDEKLKQDKLKDTEDK